MIPETLKWIGDIDGCLEIIDQRRLPAEFVKLKCETPEELYDAIKTLAVRGAPAIGVAAGFGLCLAAKELPVDIPVSQALVKLKDSAEFLASARPTAVNLFWALERMKTCIEKFAAENSNASINQFRQVILSEAMAIYHEDVRMCQQIGANGEKFITENCSVLTHCNAGALATAGQGTALSVIFEAHKKGKKFKVYADETRPLLQGARLTAWELTQAEIDTTLICDNMAGWLIKQGKIDIIITGADRIAANGDAANKIGTYTLSVLAKEHGIAFYIAAPSSTFDVSLKDGSGIVVEQRSEDELKTFNEAVIAPAAVSVYNPAFDVTDAQNITAIITEKGIIEKPNAEKVKKHLAQAQ